MVSWVKGWSMLPTQQVLACCVQAAANFTPAQKQVILNVRRKFLEQLQDIIQQRRAIIAELHDSVPDFKSGANGHATITKANPYTLNPPATWRRPRHSDSRCACAALFAMPAIVVPSDHHSWVS